MKKTSLTRALFVAGVLAAAGSMAQADAIFYPDGTHVELGQNGVENGLANAVLARSSTTAPDSQTLASLGLSDQSAPVLALNDDMGMDTGSSTTTLGAGPSSMSSTLGAGPSRMTTTTVTTTTPVYVFPNINFDRNTVLSQPHPMLSHVRSMEMDRTAAATFDTPTVAGEVSTMTSGAPNLVTTNESVASVPPSILVPSTTTTSTLGAAPAVIVPDNTVLGAGPAVIVPDDTVILPGTTTLGAGPAVILPNTTTLGAGPSNQIDPNTGSQQPNWMSQCSPSSVDCHYLPD